MLLVLDKNLFDKEKVIYALFMALNIFQMLKDINLELKMKKK